MSQVPGRLQRRQLGAHGRRPPLDLGLFGHFLRRHGSPRLQVALHRQPKNQLLPLRQHGLDVTRARRRPRPYSSSSASAFLISSVSPCSATVSTTTRSPSTDLTVPETTISCSGKPIPRNWTFSRFSARGSPPASAALALAVRPMP